jgi:hypothetical protein
MCGLLLSAAAVPGYGQICKGMPATELVQMPTFCWGECSDQIVGPQYRIDRSQAACGPGSNHYCFGLMHLVRAKRIVGDKKKKVANLKIAQGATRYTMSGIEKFPNCSIRSHVNNTWNEVNMMLMGLGEK